MASKKTRSRWASDAALQALVRYGPEESGLSALAQQARADYGVAVRQAHGTAAGIVDATQRAIPNVSHIYDRAGLDQARTASLVSGDLARLGPAAGTLRAGAAMEVAQQLGNLRSARSAALEDLQTRQVSARQGEGFAVQSARRKYTGDIAKILERSQGLAREKGAFQASTIDALAQKAAERITKRDIAKLQADTTRRGQDLSHEDRQASISQRREAAAKKKTATGAPAATRDKHLEWSTSIRSLSDQAAKYKGQLTRAEIAAKLERGRPAIKIKAGQKIPGSNQVAPADVSLPAIKAVPRDIKMTAALDVALDGHLSRATQRRLQQSGFRVRDLDLPTFAEWRRRGGNPAAQRRNRQLAEAAARAGASLGRVRG